MKKEEIMRKLFAAMALCLVSVAPAHAEALSAASAAPAAVGTPAGSAGKASPSRDAVQMALDCKEQFLRKHGLREGLTKGRNLVSVAVLVERAVYHPEYECYRLLAFKKAEARALAELVRSSAVSVSTTMEQTLFEDASSDAADFSESGKGRSAAASFMEKVRAVAVAKLDALLRENGVDPAQFAVFPEDRKKELAAHVLMTTTTQKALKTLAGVSVLASFSTEDDAGYGAVCVVMGASPSLESAAEGFRSGRKPSLAPGSAALADAIPQDPEELYASVGTRVISTAEGPVLVSYGMTTCPADGEPTARYRKRSVAERMADSLAVEQAARFLSQSISSSEETKLGEAVRETLTLAGRDMSLSAATEKAITSIFSGRVESRARELLTGMSTVKRWSLVRNGREIVGVVKVLEMPASQTARQETRQEARQEMRSEKPLLRTEGAEARPHVPAVHAGADIRPALF